MKRPGRRRPCHGFLAGFSELSSRMPAPVETDRKCIPQDSGAEWGASKRAAAPFLAHPLRDRSLRKRCLVHQRKIVLMMTGSDLPRHFQPRHPAQSAAPRKRPQTRATTAHETHATSLARSRANS
jgi:hypothetical protein